MRRRRWSDHDHYLGPFTYARDRRGYRPLALVLSSSGDDDEQCQVRLSGFGHTFIAALPNIIKPSRTWVDPSRWERERELAAATPTAPTIAQSATAA